MWGDFQHFISIAVVATVTINQYISQSHYFIKLHMNCFPGREKNMKQFINRKSTGVKYTHFEGYLHLSNVSRVFCECQEG